MNGCYPDVSLVLPCYNEEEVLRNTVTRLVQAFRDRKIEPELILVDNGSRDGTGNIIDELAAEGLPVRKQTVAMNRGYGNGILHGLPLCRAKWIGFVCADGQVDASDVVRVYEIAANLRRPKLVKVRRRFRMDGWTRKIVSIVYNLLANIVFGGLNSIDINGNPKMLPREYLARMNLSSNDWFLDAEVMIKAKRLSLGVMELNVMAQMREGGASNVRGSTCKEFLVNLFNYRFGGGSPVIAGGPGAAPEKAHVV